MTFLLTLFCLSLSLLYVFFLFNYLCISLMVFRAKPPNRCSSSASWDRLGCRRAHYCLERSSMSLFESKQKNYISRKTCSSGLQFNKIETQTQQTHPPQHITTLPNADRIQYHNYMSHIGFYERIYWIVFGCLSLFGKTIKKSGLNNIIHPINRSIDPDTDGHVMICDDYYLLKIYRG